MTDSSAYCTPLRDEYQEKAKVKGPTRPANIIRIIAIFCMSFILAVIPMDRPTVPNADTVSKRYSTKKCLLFKGGNVLSLPHNKSMDVMRVMKKADANIMVMVRVRTSTGIVLLKTFTSSCPFSLFQIIRMRRAKLVVLIPPPVEPGEAPINIRIIMTRIVALVNWPISTVLKPAVRGTTD